MNDLKHMLRRIACGLVWPGIFKIYQDCYRLENLLHLLAGEDPETA
jgi:hypothetical protein